MRTITNSLTTKKITTNKLVLGFVGIAATAIIGAAGIAGAEQLRNPNLPDPPSKAACVEFADYGFENYGQCVSWWNQHHNPGHGYGGGSTNNVSTAINVVVNGTNNAVSVVINYFF